MINGRNMKLPKNLSNRNILKVAKFCVCSIYHFWSIKKVGKSGKKQTHPPLLPLSRVKQTEKENTNGAYKSET